MSKYFYMSLSDEELEERRKLEERATKMKLNRQERAIAHSNVEAIIAEQARRHHEKYGLKD